MYGTNEKPLFPRNGHTLMVIQVCRISGGKGQKEASLDDQANHGEAEIRRRYSGTVKFTVISTKAKGEWSDRPELNQLRELLQSNNYDVLFTEDLGRTIRGGEGFEICKLAVRHGVRVIAPHDYIDTASQDWEEDVLEACKEHTQYNSRVSKRLKQKLMNRFQKGIGAAGRLIAGYENPTNGKSYADWIKIDSATPILRKAFSMLRETQNAQIVADYFNEISFPVGKYTRAKKWSSKLVRELMRNTVLKGFPQRGKRFTVKDPKNNHRVSIINPDGPTFVEYPHLAHIEPAEFDEVNQLFDLKYKSYSAKIKAGQKYVSSGRKQNSRFPGMHARCWYCGRPYYWGANGKKDNLICMGALKYECFNSLGLPSGRIIDAIMEKLTTFLCSLDGFEPQYRQMLEEALDDATCNFSHLESDLNSSSIQLEKEMKNFTEAVRKCGEDPLLITEIVKIRESQKQLALERDAFERRKKAKPNLPSSTAEIRLLLEKKLKEIALHSAEGIHWLRKVVPEIWIQVVQPVDGGDFGLRATFTISLAGSIQDADRIPGLDKLFTQTHKIDLFDHPERIRIREECMRLLNSGVGQKQIAKMHLKVHEYTVYRAIKLHRYMTQNGINDPYAIIDNIPAGNQLFKRTKNKRYRFCPLEGYEQKKI